MSQLRQRFLTFLSRSSHSLSHDFLWEGWVPREPNVSYRCIHPAKGPQANIIWTEQKYKSWLTPDKINNNQQNHEHLLFIRYRLFPRDHSLPVDTICLPRVLHLRPMQRRTGRGDPKDTPHLCTNKNHGRLKKNIRIGDVQHSSKLCSSLTLLFKIHNACLVALSLA